MRALAGDRVRARALPVWLSSARWMRRHPALAATLCAGLFVAAGSLAFGLREHAVAARVTRLADKELVRGLVSEAHDFWPAARATIDPMEAWLARAEDVLARRADHEGSWAELTARAEPYSVEDRLRDGAAARENLRTLVYELDLLRALVESGDRLAPPSPPTPEVVREREAHARALIERPAREVVVELRARVGELRAILLRDTERWQPDLAQLNDFELALERNEHTLSTRLTMRFADPLDAWRHGSLSRLVDDLGALARLAGRVREQLAATRSLAHDAEVYAERWDAARAAIALSPRYAGLDLFPVFGCIPLGEDPKSGLHEFALALSGTTPARDADGRLLLDETSAVVLVLLPGGRFDMGGHQAGEQARTAVVQPVHTVELAPFFVSKHEISAAQAERMGDLPRERKQPEDGRLALTIDWVRGRELLLRHGLDLPTEAQWEYAARAGQLGPFDLQGQANIADASFRSALLAQGQSFEDEFAKFDDGFAGIAPIGSYRPNAFGLHDTLGNVSEWCLDAFVMRGYSTLMARSGDGLRATITVAAMRSVRGGAAIWSPKRAHPCERWGEEPNRPSSATGLRATCSLAPR